MSVIFADIQAVQDRYSAERGVPKYAAEFATAAAHGRPGLVDQWLLKRHEPIPPTIMGLLSTGSVRYVDDAGPRPDVVHNLAPFQSVGRGLTHHDLLDPEFRGAKVVATLYDLIPMLYPQVYFRDPVFRDDYLLACSFLQNADLVLAISDSAARDAVDHLGLDARKVVAVGTGVPGSFEPSADRAAVLAHLASKFRSIRPGYLLYVGGIDFRKNMEGLLQAYALLDTETRRAHPLVVVCRLVGDSARHLRQTLRTLGIKRDVILTDLVDEATLALLYQGTDLFIFPSLYEGFGLPVIEALRSGAPVIVGDNSSLRDIVSVPEARFDAGSPAAIAQSIRDTLASEEARTRTLREVDHSAHTWQAVVENTSAAYAKLAPKRSVPQKRRIALVTPLPPSATGIAIYNHRLIRSLSSIIDIDVFSQPEAHDLDIPGVRQFHYGAFGPQRLLDDYLEVVIAIGNSFYHLNEFEILKRYGGTVMLHDARVSGLLHNVKSLRPDLLTPSEYTSLEQIERGEFPGELGSYPAYEFAEQIRLNALMSGTITRSAHRVLLHSAAGSSIARLEAPSDARDRIEQIPLAFATPTTLRRDDADAITSFGYLSAAKQTPLLCAAFVLAAQQLPDITFAFVGHLGDGSLRSTMDSLIERGGVRGRIVVTDWQDEEQYATWLSRSLITIQPRATFNGEASAAVTESIGAGIPTIVSDVGWMAELPDDVAIKVATTVSAEHLARLIVDLARSPERLRAMSERSLDYAAEHSFDAVAQRLIDIISR
jgi:glycosyltransferase involved in cell wall biosynthesis